MRWLAAVALALWGQGAFADAADVLRDFAERLYSVGEADAGTSEIWARLEADALHRLSDEAGSLTVTDDNGRTPLMIAAANGYGFAVNWLLRRAEVRRTLDLRDAEGLSAFDLSQLALRKTALACRPRAESSAVVTPMLVGLPYYLDRKPYPAISVALLEAGAERADTDLRAYWLNACPTASPELRERIAGDAPVQRSLLEGALGVLAAKCTEEARLRHRSIERMFANRRDAAGVIAQSRAQMEDRIAACADELAGFLPD